MCLQLAGTAGAARGRSDASSVRCPDSDVGGESLRAGNPALGLRSSGPFTTARPASLVTAGLDRAALTGFKRALAHASARLGEKAGNLPQYASTGGPVSIEGEQYFDTVLLERRKPLSVKNSASGP
jgi:hypothetical protein